MKANKVSWFSATEFDWETSVETRKVGKIERAYKKMRKVLKIVFALIAIVGVLMYFFAPEFQYFVEIPIINLNQTTSSYVVVIFGILGMIFI